MIQELFLDKIDAAGHVGLRLSPNTCSSFGITISALVSALPFDLHFASFDLQYIYLKFLPTGGI
jgi:hypothetical protein